MLVTLTTEWKVIGNLPGATDASPVSGYELHGWFLITCMHAERGGGKGESERERERGNVTSFGAHL